MELFRKKIGPVFLKEDSDADAYVEKLNSLVEKAQGELKQKIEAEIKLASYGIIGEKNIAFELKNCDKDMYILHDLYFEWNDLQAQIDYMIITRKRIYVIECKNLIGNIEIDSSGNFVRSYELFGKKMKEGLYSPITQNERHLLVIKGLRGQDKGFLAKKLFENNFSSTYKSLVVLANPKTYLNAKFAKKEVKRKVVRADQLVAYIKEKDRELNDYTFTIDEMKSLAEFFLKKNIPERSDYAKKYETLLEMANAEPVEEPKLQDSVAEVPALEKPEQATAAKICPRCGAELVKRIARKGSNAGQEFYGCKGFPNCRYTENL